MDVLNRRMFNRNARNKLSNMGGLPSVAKFQSGGLASSDFFRDVTKLPDFMVGTLFPGRPNEHSGFVYPGMDPIKFKSPTKFDDPSKADLVRIARKAAQEGVGSLSPLELSILNVAQARFQVSQIPTSGTRGGELVKGIADLLAQPAGVAVGLTKSLMTGDPNKDNFAGRAARNIPSQEFLESLGFNFNQPKRPAGKRPQGVPKYDSPITGVPDNIFSPFIEGKDFAQASADNAALAEAQGAKGQVLIREEDEFNKDAVPAIIKSFDEEGKEIEPKPFGEPTKEPVLDSEQIKKDQEDEQVGMPSSPSAEQILRNIQDEQKQVVTDVTGKADISDDTKEDEIPEVPVSKPKEIPEVPVSKPEELVKEVFKTGTDEQKTNVIDDMIKQFTDRAPKYEGINKGLAIAKIGFAMAAGESPNAITNIGKALSDGADMFIKDNKEKEAFKRQVDLSALQYGLTESAKIRAAERAEETAFTDFVDSDGNLVRVSVADYKANGNKLPKGLQTVAMFTANQKAINDRSKTSKDLIEDLYKKKFLKFSDQTKITGEYSTAVQLASEAETAGTLIETVIMNAGDVVGGYAEAKQVGANFLNFFGSRVPEGWNNKKLRINELKAALQSVVKTTLGTTQSANSISNRDVELLIEGFLAEGVITYNKQTGIVDMSTTMISREQFVASLQKGLGAVRRAQANALNQMTSIENQLRGALTATGYDASTIIDPLRTGLVMPGSVGKEGFKQGSLKLGSDGIWSQI